MNEPTPSADDLLANASREEILSALFANMVIQQTNMAMMLLGKVAHPETGQFMHDVDAARMFIEQLEMIEAKTKGNLNQQESALLKQALAAVHMSFVEAVNAPAPTPGIITPQSAQKPDSSSAPAPTASASAATPAPATAAPATEPAPEDKKAASPSEEKPATPEESRKKFSKKY